MTFRGQIKPPLTQGAMYGLGISLGERSICQSGQLALIWDQGPGVPFQYWQSRGATR